MHRLGQYTPIHQKEMHTRPGPGHYSSKNHCLGYYILQRWLYSEDLLMDVFHGKL